MFPEWETREKKRPKKKKNLLAPYFSTRRRYKTRRDTAGLLVRANESSSSKTLRKGGSERKTQSSLSLSLPRIPLPGGPTRAHPAVSKWLSLTFSLFFFSHHCSPFQTHTHTHFLPHHHTHPLSPTPSLHHFSGMRRHFLSRPVLKQHMCVCVIRATSSTSAFSIQHLNIYHDTHPREKKNSLSGLPISQR